MKKINIAEICRKVECSHALSRVNCYLINNKIKCWVACGRGEIEEEYSCCIVCQNDECKNLDTGLRYLVQKRKFEKEIANVQR